MVGMPHHLIDVYTHYDTMIPLVLVFKVCLRSCRNSIINSVCTLIGKQLCGALSKTSANFSVGFRSWGLHSLRAR